MKNSKIEWCDHTYNPWIGCSKVSPGCEHCYAEALNHRMHWCVWGPRGRRQRTSESYREEPLKWEREAAHEADRFNGEPCLTVSPRVFCGSLCDWLDDEVPVEWLSDLLDLIRLTPALDWLLLTKRPENFRDRLSMVSDRALRAGNIDLVGWLDRTQSARGWLEGNPPSNVWVGASVEDQQRADERIPALVQIPARVRFLSCEPLLGPVDIVRYLPGVGVRKVPTGAECFPVPGDVHWVICGGESGAKARPMNPHWVFELRDQCVLTGTPFFFKQWGEWAAVACPESDPGAVMPPGRGGYWAGDEFRLDEYEAGFPHSVHVGKKVAGKELAGRTYESFPEVRHD